MAFAMIKNPNKPGELKPFVLSPSNMSTFKQCPRRFQGQSITAELPWRASTQKSRGSLVHTEVEKALRHGIQAVTNWTDGIDVYYTQDMIQQVRKEVADGSKLFIEHEMIINDRMQSATEGWWDSDAILRAKADSVVIPPSVDRPLKLIDIKTGKKWDEDDFQLRVEAMLAHLIYKYPTIEYEYWYVDIGETVSGLIDFRIGLSLVQDVIGQMRDMKLAIKNNDYPFRKNNFCGFCGLTSCPHYKKR